MSKISTVKARVQFSDVVNRAAYGKERVVLTRHGKQIAAVVPIDDIERLEALEELKDLQDALAAKKEAKRKGTTPLAQLKKELGL